MRVNVSLAPVPHMPAIVGPHELSWNYILDQIFADAARQGVSDLDLTLPSAPLVEAAQLRASLTSLEREAEGSSRAAAWLTGTKVAAAFSKTAPESVSDSAYRRLYTLRFGALAPSSLRHRVHPRAPWLEDSAMSIFSLPAKLWGLPIRFAYLFKRPDLADRAGFQMRRRFASERAVPAYYHLTTWSRNRD